MKAVASICYRHFLAQTNVLFIIGGKSNNTDILETFRGMGDALREHFAAHGPTPLYVVVGRGGPNLVRGMGNLAETLREPRAALPLLRLRQRDLRGRELRQEGRRLDEGRRARGDRPRRMRPDARVNVPTVDVKGERAMYRDRAFQGFPYYLGIRSLADVATPEDRVCVLNIMGGESRHGDADQPRLLRRQRRVRHLAGARGPDAEDDRRRHPGLQQRPRGAGRRAHGFNTGVVYLPPSGVRDGVAELIRVNPDLEKIVIITEKIAVHDAREIRAMAPGQRRRHHRRQLPRRRRLVEPGAHRRRARRRPSRTSR